MATVHKRISKDIFNTDTCPQTVRLTLSDYRKAVVYAMLPSGVDTVSCKEIRRKKTGLLQSTQNLRVAYKCTKTGGISVSNF